MSFLSTTFYKSRKFVPNKFERNNYIVILEIHSSLPLSNSVLFLFVNFKCIKNRQQTLTVIQYLNMVKIKSKNTLSPTVYNQDLIQDILHLYKYLVSIINSFILNYSSQFVSIHPEKRLTSCHTHLAYNVIHTLLRRRWNIKKLIRPLSSQI